MKIVFYSSSNSRSKIVLQSQEPTQRHMYINNVNLNYVTALHVEKQTKWCVKPSNQYLVYFFK